MDLVNIAESSSAQFVQLFYQNYDNQRNLLGNLYREDSAIVWNGNAIAGASQFSEFLSRLPASQHEVAAYDCQPIAATMNAQGACGILINVHGDVKYGDSPGKKSFSQTFTLMPVEGQATSFFIQSDVFRHV
ncbi:nuclear transport factor 2 [Zychaea mexicana]|uniref:nuclear transport factor 2 n=1 Tax=Zychaea mexicana TaxID=64656 RepID=UPI0022FDE5D3|nr:nuclear transport factor 2 [Zychaea mexicana]KAI9484807.1 nuclear transport factor 2 [Zychaea mexicana]